MTVQPMVGRWRLANVMSDLTNEHYLEQFTSPFELINVAIMRARELCKGRRPQVETDSINKAFIALEEIAQTNMMPSAEESEAAEAYTEEYGYGYEDYESEYEYPEE